MERKYYISMKRPAEVEAVEFDFGEILNPLEVINSVSVAVAPLVTGGLAISGTPTLSGKIVCQLVSGGVVDVEYIVTFAIITTMASPFLAQTRIADLYVHLV